MFVLAIFCILWYIFLLNVAKYAFTFHFSWINLWGIIPGLTHGVGKGKRRASPMWTQWRNVDLSGRDDEWGITDWKGVLYVDKGVGQLNQN